MTAKQDTLEQLAQEAAGELADDSVAVGALINRAHLKGVVLERAEAVALIGWARSHPSPAGKADRRKGKRRKTDRDPVSPVGRTLIGDVVDDLYVERDPAAAGGVPLPGSWRLMRAVYGGASREVLEAATTEDSPGIALFTAAGTHLPPGLHIVAGQTGGAKTAIAVNMALAAIEAGYPVLYVSPELDPPELAARMIGLAGGISWSKLALRRKVEWESYQEGRKRAIERLRLPLRRMVALVPEGGLTAGAVQEAALALWREHDHVPLVIFDYLQAAVASADNRCLPLREQVAAVTIELRRLSRHIAEEPLWPGCPVLVTSITARPSANGEPGVPGMDGTEPDQLRISDLETLKALPMEAGEIEATSVTVWVAALGERGQNAQTRPLTLRLAKNRIGLSGQWIPFAFNGSTGQLTEEPSRYAAAALDDARRAKDRESRFMRRLKLPEVLD